MSDARKLILRSKSDRKNKNDDRKSNDLMRKLQGNIKRDSFGALEELVQCGICLGRLNNPRMLPCQHTFCLSCLRMQVIAKNMLNKKPTTMNDNNNSTTEVAINCPVCQVQVVFDKGVQSVDETLPRNLYIAALLQVIDDDSGINDKRVAKSEATATTVDNYRCVNCQTISSDGQQEQICQHCMQVFCRVCWNEHLTSLQSNQSQLLLKQIDESQMRLLHKRDNFEQCCQQIHAKIKMAAQEKIAVIQQIETHAYKEVQSMHEQNQIRYEIIGDKILELKTKLTLSNSNSSSSSTRSNSDNHVGFVVGTFMKLHRETSQILNEVHNYADAHLIFDSDTFRVEQDTEGIYYKDGDNDDDQKQQQDGGVVGHVNNPLLNDETLELYYKTRTFEPVLIWNKCPRPAQIAIPPWDNTKLYIAATDSHTVLILDRSKVKLVGRLQSSELLCPQGLAFSQRHQEIYVSDKWRHYIHVFAMNGEYLRAISLKGRVGRLRSPDSMACGPNDELIVCDSGNDRVLVLDPIGDTTLISIIGQIDGNKTDLNRPTGVAVYGQRVIVADTGNHRIKVYDLMPIKSKNNSGVVEKLFEFGSLGRGRGQFRSAEVVAVDARGFILVGDGGNGRIQVFKPDGTLVKIYGDDKFGWISGIFVTNDMHIITTDCKKRTLRIF